MDLTMIESGFFRHMLMDSRFTSSLHNPINLEEQSSDVKTLLMIIAGSPCRVEKRCKSWRNAKRLYLLKQKYQLDRLQPWFSKLAGDWCKEAPFEALCLACNNPCYDENLARSAILWGLEERTAEDLFNAEYFVDDMASEPEESRKLSLLDPSNTHVKLGIDLGFKGTMAYCKAFSNLNWEMMDWQYTAEVFSETIRYFEKERGTTVCTFVGEKTCIGSWLRFG